MIINTNNAKDKVIINMKLRKRSSELSATKSPPKSTTITAVEPDDPAYIASGVFVDGQWKMDCDKFKHAVLTADTCEKQIATLKAQLELAHQTIVSTAEEVSGQKKEDIDVTGYGYDVKIKRRNQYRWDSEELNKIFASKQTLPAHVKKQLSVDKRVYERLDDSMKNVLRPALNVINQKPSINITRRN